VWKKLENCSRNRWGKSWKETHGLEPEDQTRVKREILTGEKKLFARKFQEELGEKM